MPKPTWGNIALHYFIGSLMLLDAMWLVQLHDYVFASVAALAAIVVLFIMTPTIRRRSQAPATLAVAQP